MRMKILAVTSVVALAVFIGAWAWVVPNQPVVGAGLEAQPAFSANEPGVLTESQAVSKAVEHATRLGLQGPPQGVAARQMTLREAVKMTSGGEAPDEAKAVGRDPNMIVWVVSIKGPVDLKLPHGGKFQAMHLTIDSQTGDWMDVGAYHDPATLPMPVP